MISSAGAASGAVRMSADHLVCVRGGRCVFSDLSFTVERDSLLAVRGPNGAGKSSLLRVIAGLLDLDAGAVRIEGLGDRPQATAIHFIAHQDGLKPQLSAGEALAFSQRLLGGDGPLAPILAEMGLVRQADLPVQFLSAGQRRRLALARLLASPRPIWLLDEPMSALDAAGRDLLRQILERHLAGGGLAIAATHDTLPVAGETLVLRAAEAGAAA
ncbi:MAG: heme ABC exporter ATP-binding protein CcmA [Alphaproteobacteria bacterium]|nr:heme ABC exporter ATP-binding protein CcmA [Alphaproteobacteria bacterium]